MYKSKIIKSSTLPRGFTLAETLITLVIIGVVAALTVPTLIVKYQKEQTVTRLKKAYSALSQTTQRAIADNGPISTWKYTSEEDRDSVKFVQTYILPYMNILNTCTDASGNKITTGDCSFEFNRLNPSLSKVTEDSSNDRFILVDGTKISFWAGVGYCSVTVDINNSRKPNIQGKDVFSFIYYTNSSNSYLNGKFKPYGFDRTRANILSSSVNGSCNRNSTYQAGRMCAALIIKDGWQIADDYPW